MAAQYRVRSQPELEEALDTVGSQLRAWNSKLERAIERGTASDRYEAAMWADTYRTQAQTLRFALGESDRLY